MVKKKKRERERIQTCLAGLHRYCVFYKHKVCGDPVSNKSIGTIFSNSICSLPVSVSYLVTVVIFQTIIIVIFAIVICDQ